MNNTMKSGLALGLLSISLMLASCASTGSAPTSVPAAPPSHSPAQQAAVAAAASKAGPEFPGFKLSVRKGEEFYCQKRNPTGSRARMVEICYTREQMVKMAENNADFFRQVEANGSHDTLRIDAPR